MGSTWAAIRNDFEKNRSDVMRLVENWRLLLRRAWSVRLMLLAGVLSGAEVVLPLVCAAVREFILKILPLAVRLPWNLLP